MPARSLHFPVEREQQFAKNVQEEKSVNLTKIIIDFYLNHALKPSLYYFYQSVIFSYLGPY